MSVQDSASVQLPHRQSLIPAQMSATSLAWPSTYRDLKWCWLARCRRAGIATSASGDCTRTERLDRDSASRRYRVPVFVTATTIMPTGDLTLTFARPAITWQRNLMTHRFSRRRTGIRRTTRLSARGTLPANESGEWRTRRLGRVMRSFLVRMTDERRLNRTGRSREGTYGSCGITAQRLTMV